MAQGIGEFEDFFEGIGSCLCLTIRLSRTLTARRLEVITETGRRRRFSKDDKARIVEETLVPGPGSFPRLRGDTG